MDIVERLCDGGRKLGAKATQTQLSAVQELMQLLSAGSVCKSQSIAMRNGGAPGALVSIMAREGGAPDKTRMEAAEIATCLAQHDFPSAELLYRAGIVKVVASEPENGLLLNALLVVIRGLTSGCRERLYEELLASGAVPKICNSLESPELNEVCARIMGWVTSVVFCREKLRDLGLVPVMVSACRSCPTSKFHLNMIMNLALSDSLLICLKDCDVLGVMQEILDSDHDLDFSLDGPQIAHLNAVATLALIYGSDARSNPVADRLLEAHDHTLSLVHALEACASGRGIMGGLMWRPSHVLKMIQALSYKQTHSERLIANGAVSVIVRVMLNEKLSNGRKSLVSHNGGGEPNEAEKITGGTGAGDGVTKSYDPLLAESTRKLLGSVRRSSIPSGASHQEPPSPSLAHGPPSHDPPDSPVTSAWKLVDVDLALYSCRTLTNMASWSSLRRSLVDQGVIRVMSLFREHHDLRVADSAQTCLLLLDETKENEEAKNALLTQSSVNDHEDEEEQDYDVFLSHKRTDAKDFARALYNLLVLRGLKTFLDYEFRSELNDLAKIVSRCKNLIFVLTDNVLESEWCLKELESAVDHKVNVIFVTKEGSRWKDIHGNKVCDFPPQHLIDKLPEKVKGLMTRKAIAHSDEYYQAFVETLLKKINQGGQTKKKLANAANVITHLIASSSSRRDSGNSLPSLPGGGESRGLSFGGLNATPSPQLQPSQSNGGALQPHYLAYGHSSSSFHSSHQHQQSNGHPLSHGGPRRDTSFNNASPLGDHFSSHPPTTPHQLTANDVQQAVSSATNQAVSQAAQHINSHLGGVIAAQQTMVEGHLHGVQQMLRSVSGQMSQVQSEIPSSVGKMHRDALGRINEMQLHLNNDMEYLKREQAEMKSMMAHLSIGMAKITTMLSDQIVPQLNSAHARSAEVGSSFNGRALVPNHSGGNSPAVAGGAGRGTWAIEIDRSSRTSTQSIDSDTQLILDLARYRNHRLLPPSPSPYTSTAGQANGQSQLQAAAADDTVSPSLRNGDHQDRDRTSLPTLPTPLLANRPESPSILHQQQQQQGKTKGQRDFAYSQPDQPMTTRLKPNELKQLREQAHGMALGGSGVIGNSSITQQNM